MFLPIVRTAPVLAIVLASALPGMIFAAPEDPPSHFRATGVVESVDPSANTFKLQTREGEVLMITVNDETRFVSRGGEIDGLEDIEVGMSAWVRGHITAEGEHIAKTVAVGDPQDRPDLDRYAGLVRSVDLSAATFSIELRDGGGATFQTNERTRFHSRDGSVDSLEDVKQGMAVGVGAILQDDESLLALVVLAGNPKDRPDRDVVIRAIGEIVGLGDRTFTLETRGGEEVMIAVDSSTVFRSPGEGLDSFDDLELGMIVAVGGKKTADGKILAVWVAVGFPRPGEGGRPDRPAPKPGHDPQPDPTATPESTPSS